MIKLALLVLAEGVIGVALAGVVLAVVIPLLLRFNWIVGRATGTVAIVAILVMAVAAVLFRPGSAISRCSRRGE